MLDYAVETAFRADTRRLPNGTWGLPRRATEFFPDACAPSINNASAISCGIQVGGRTRAGRDPQFLTYRSAPGL